MKKLLNERLMLGLLSLLMPLSLLAQDIKVQGVVKDKAGETVIGATVMQKGTSNGTVTDFDGNFSLTVPFKATLVVSYIGYTTQEVVVDGKSSFEIVLQDDSQVLNEVVVVGYGTMDKKELTSAISHVGEKDFLTASSLDPSMMIQGKVPGVSITNTGAGVLLYSKKVAAAKGLKVCLKGISSEVKDVMDVTGFSNFFDYA